MRIKDIEKVDRPREKLKRYGVDVLKNEELLSLILGTGIKGKNVLELSESILKLLAKQSYRCSYEDLQHTAGLGEAKISAILASLELGKRIYTKKQARLLLSPKNVWNEMKEIRSQKKEYFVVFFLDVRNQIIRQETVSIGSLNASLVHPREVFEPAIKYLAAQILIAHNHPSGDPSPSPEDLEITKRLCEAGKILGIEIIDHVIVATTKFLSLKSKNLL